MIPLVCEPPDPWRESFGPFCNIPMPLRRCDRELAKLLVVSDAMVLDDSGGLELVINETSLMRLGGATAMSGGRLRAFTNG
jgi:hypothetical protein